MPDVADNKISESAIALLKEIIAIPSFSKEEDAVAGHIGLFFSKRMIAASRVGNNVFALNKNFEKNKPTLLLNSHIDTVRPNNGYTIHPFTPIEKEGKIFGLGSNDAGGPLVSLLATFLHFYEKDLPWNIAFAATAEEEISGTGGIEYALKHLPKIDCAIVGEPTGMQMAIAERGLMVVDCTTIGVAGHAARNEGVNAVYKAIKDIEWIRSYSFERVSGLTGPVQMNVTVIETDNKTHNIVPSACKFIVDCRINELYTHEEVLETIKRNVQAEANPRSMRLRATIIPESHPLVNAGLSIGRTTYGSPTSSDKSLMPFPALKMGPGDSARSHTADEYIYRKEIEEAIEIYIQLITSFFEFAQTSKSYYP